MTINEKLDYLIDSGISKGYTYLKVLLNRSVSNDTATFNNLNPDDIIISTSHQNNGGAPSGNIEFTRVVSGGEVLLAHDDIPNSDGVYRGSFAIVRVTDTTITLRLSTHYTSTRTIVLLSRKPINY